MGPQIDQDLVERSAAAPHAARDSHEFEPAAVDILSDLGFSDQIVRSLPIGICIYDEGGNCLTANELIAQLIGASLEQVKAQNFHRIESWKSSGLYDLALKTLHTGEPTSSVVRVRTSFGKELWPAVRFSSLQSRGRKFLMHFVEDLTVFKRAEQKHRETVEAYEKLFTYSMDGALLTQPDGTVLAANPAACAILGMSEEEIRGRGRQGLTVPGDIRHDAAVEERSRTGRVRAVFTMIRGNGEQFEAEVTSVAYKDRDGKSLAHVLFRDITERRRVENEVRSREARYRGVVETSPDGFLVIDVQGRLLETNDAYARLSGYSREELLRMTLSDLEAKEEPAETSSHVAMVMRDGHDRYETLHKRKNGSVWPAEVVVTYWPLEGGRLFAFLKDLTKSRQAEDYLRVATLIYQSSAEAVMVTDEQNRIIDINPAFVRQTGYTLEEVRGKNPSLLKSGRHDRRFYRKMWRDLQQKDHWQGEIWDRRKDGSLHAKFSSIRVIRHADGRVFRHIAQFFDITEQKHKEELIWRQANYDPLTELPNRRLLQDRLERETRRTRISGQPLALLFIDLDRFKDINDVLGHAKGDRLLVQAAQRIKQCVRDTDMVARLGGDEFTVILSNFRERVQLERIAQNIIRALSEPFDLGEGDLNYLSASIGITLYPNDAQSIEELLKNADQAMYAAKSQGRGRFSYFTSSMQREGQDRLTLTNDLRTALAQRELEVHYQPIMDAASGRIVKAEALLRWAHPVRGMVAPATFVPLAEESGLIVEIGDWVFERAVESIERWQEHTGHLIQVSVNVSPVQFQQDFGQRWMEKLAIKAGAKSLLALEITEGLLMKNSSRVRGLLSEYRRNGIEISIDDFGTGFSSLSYIKQFNIDYLKIDRTFVHQITQNASDATLAEAIVVMAHKLGIKTIAEGVETSAQRDMLVSFGCDYLQGYLFSRPVPAEKFEKLLSVEPAERD